MTNSDHYDRLRGHWWLSINSLRVLIFMLCAFMAFILLGIMSDFASFHPDLHLALPGQAISNIHYYRAIVLFAIAMLGFWGSLLGHENSLKAFLILGCIYALIFVTLDVAHDYLQPSDHEEANLEFEKRMRGMELQYVWFNRTANAPPVGEEATRAWDALQTSLLCCGLSNSQDWDRLRPKAVAQHVYPASCCMSAREYSKEPIDAMNSLCFGPGISPNFHLRGCLEAFELFKPTFLPIFKFIYPILICALVCIGFYLQLLNRLASESDFHLEKQSATNQLTFQRVQGNYLRKPLISRDLKVDQLQLQHHWLYPYAFSVEQNSNLYFPPGSYGSLQ